MNIATPHQHYTRAITEQVLNALGREPALDHMCNGCDAPHASGVAFCVRCDCDTEGYTIDAEPEHDALGDLADYLYDMRRDDALMGGVW